ncbi:MAG TPA: 3-deoxy-manno-octulosonate cytidylyltransferase [Parachlamydiales bacterium]|nr:3-deoxy-manno-octulosonate cytidylyltransferase [Parachlamydiales bacterium]
MHKDKTVACIIPARLNSVRFPRKILAPVQGKPLIQWTWEAALRVSLFDRIVVAVDDVETAAAVESFGGEWMLTSRECMNGTERLLQLMKEGRVSADIWVNWQADEPLVHEEMIRELLFTARQEGIDVWSLKKRVDAQEELCSSHVVKVVCDAAGFALYFSRSALPFYRDDIPFKERLYYKHVGLYAYTASALHRIASFPPSFLEEAEKLEQLRFLAHGLKINLRETRHESLGIDLPEHLACLGPRLNGVKNHKLLDVNGL